MGHCRFTKLLLIGAVSLLILVCVPAAFAQESEGAALSGGEWVYACAVASYQGIPVGVARFNLSISMPPDYYIQETVYIYSAQYGVIADSTRQWSYFRYTAYEGYWTIPVPEDGYATILDEVYDSGGGLLSTSFASADCTTGELVTSQGSIFNPMIPAGFELHSLSCSSAVFDLPGGEPVGDNAVYAGQTWFVNPIPEIGPDGKDYTEIFVGGWITGYIPTACIG